jgi:diguanylate cyclase (GGDEF)-like protein/PAS domain S-box-containing protein
LEIGTGSQDMDTEKTVKPTMEQALKESEERLKAYFNNAPDGIYTCDLKGMFLYGNRKAEEITGYARAELEGKNFLKLRLLPQEYLAKAVKLLAQNAIGRPTGPDEFELRRKDGSLVNVEINTTPIKMGGKTVVIGFVRDISKRKKAEEALKESEENFRNSLDNSPLGIRIITEEGKTIYANKAVLNIYGYANLNELQTIPAAKRHAPESYAEHQQMKEKMLNMHVPLNYELDVVRKDGTIRHLMANRGEVLWNGKRQVQVLYQDITERKKAEAALEESERRYRTLFESAGEGIAIADIETKKLRYVNPAICIMLGYSQDELTKMSVMDIHPEDSMEQVLAEFDAQARGEKVLSTLPCLKKDGTIIFVDIKTGKANINGKEYAIGFFNDITERKKAEQAQQASEENFRNSINNSPLGIRIIDGLGNTLYANQAILDMYGYNNLDEMNSIPGKERHTPESWAIHQERMKKQEIGEPVPANYTASIVRKNGEIRQLQASIGEVLWNGQRQYQVLYQDITERQKAEEALAQAMERDTDIAILAGHLVSETSIQDISDKVLESAERLTKSAFGFVGYIDPETGYMVSPTMTRGIWKSCQIKDKTAIFKKFGGLWGWVLNNRRSLMTNAPADDPRSAGTPAGHLPIKNFLSAPALIGKELVGQVALANSSRDYDERDLAFIERIATLYATALQRKRMEDIISQLAYHDPLTGLPNRNLFNDRSALALAHAKRYQERIALMVLDVDHFKEINDTLGHSAGDQLLRDFSNRLVSVLRKTDTVSRIGGDEFMVLLPEVVDAEDAVDVARKILEAIRRPFMFQERGVRITTSIGIATYPEDGENIEALLKYADTAMYQAKEAGRDNYHRGAPKTGTATRV